VFDDHRVALEELWRRYRVRSLFLFGSAARDDFDPGRSDVDLLVEFEALPRAGMRTPASASARRSRTCSAATSTLWRSPPFAIPT